MTRDVPKKIRGRLELWSLKLMDPTVLFALACFTMPAARIGDPSALLQLLCEPSIWIGVVATLALVWFARSGEQVGLEVWEVRAATWYLLNGLVFHYIFDYCIPVLNAVPTIRSMYQEMDLRYGCLPGLLPCPGAPPGGGGGDKPMDASVWVLCHIECFVDAPICLLVFAAYLRGWSIRKPLELLLAGLQIAGTFVFQGTELYAGLRHTPPPPHNVGGPRGVLQNLILDPFSNTAGFEAQFLFFWFAFCTANTLWYIVPCLLAWVAGKDLVAVIDQGRPARRTH